MCFFYGNAIYTIGNGFSSSMLAHIEKEINFETVHYDMAYDEEGNRIDFLSLEINGINVTINYMEIMN